MSRPEEQSPAPAADPVPADVPSLQTALAAAETRAKEAETRADANRDQQIRALAELDNVRKRASRDIEQAHKFALEKFAAELIGVKDSLELGLASASTSDAKGLLSGTEATLKLLSKAFEKVGVTELIPQGQPFNPELHEAMVTQESKDVPSNTVLQVVQKGYQLNGRLLRPARVIVSREPANG
jgi:molecular chaperone GrpE